MLVRSLPLSTSLCYFRVHFAGTESATIWCGFMSGAVQAGKRAAVEVLYDLRPQLVTPHDLAEARPTRKPVKRRTRTRSKIIKWTLSIGAVVVLGFTVRKIVQKTILKR